MEKKQIFGVNYLIFRLKRMHCWLKVLCLRFWDAWPGARGGRADSNAQQNILSSVSSERAALARTYEPPVARYNTPLLLRNLPVPMDGSDHWNVGSRTLQTHAPTHQPPNHRGTLSPVILLSKLQSKKSIFKWRLKKTSLNANQTKRIGYFYLNNRPGPTKSKNDW